jgi:hypothetical protein
MKTKITSSVLIAILAIALTLGYIMVTQAAEDIQQITVCVNNVGSMRLKDGIFGDCKKNETELSWNMLGQATKQPHMFDGNGQDLGIAVDHMLVFNPELKLFFNALNTANNTPDDKYFVKFLPLETDIFFEQQDCKGTPFVDTKTIQAQFVYAQRRNQVGFTGTPPYPFFKLILDRTRVTRVALSKYGMGFNECINISPDSFDSTSQLQEISLPFTLPLAWPLQVEMK